MESPLSRTSIDVIEQLEARLQRIEYVTCGYFDKSKLTDDTRSASLRLRNLEQSLDQLVSKSRVIQELLKLRKLFP